MRSERLTGFVIHQRPYREKRAIYTLFCDAVGVIDGVGAKGLLSFLPLTVFATGKTALKTLTEATYIHSKPLPVKPLPSKSDGDDNHPCIAPFSMMRLSGQAYYAGLYLNELLYKLLLKESPSNPLWQSYFFAIAALTQLPDQGDAIRHLRITLRRFELALFEELGVSIDWQAHRPSNSYYRFGPDLGFVPCRAWDKAAIVLTADELDRLKELCQQLVANGAVGGDDGRLRQLGLIHKAHIDELLGHRPLHSRRLWQDMMTLKMQQNNSNKTQNKRKRGNHDCTFVGRKY